MPDIGTLNLTIESNAQQAASGLDQLAKKLKSVKSNAEGYDLSNVQTQISNIVNAVKGSEKTVASLGTLFNAIANFSKVKTPKIDVKPIEELKKAFGKGINTGNVGSQLNQLRTALEGDWNTAKVEDVKTVLSAISTGARELKESGVSSAAKELSTLTKELNNYAAAQEKIKANIGANAGSNGGITASVESAESKKVGNNIPEGVVEGVKEKLSTVEEAGTSIANAVLGGTKDTLGIQSPSKEFKIIGEYIVEGMIEGILAKKSEIQSVMSDLAQSLTGTAKETVSAPGDWRGAMMGLDSGKKSKSKNKDGGVLDSIKQLTGALQGAGGLNDYAEGLVAISSAIESGAKSYLTLGRLATSMEKVKRASEGFKLPDFSRLESLARSLQENFNAESGLKRIAEGMEAIKKASEGFKMPNMKGIEKVVAAMNGTSSAAQSPQGGPSGGKTFSGELEQVSEQVQAAQTGLAAMNGELSTTFEAFQAGGFGGFDQFKEMLDMLVQYKSQRALGSGEGETGLQATSWKDTAIEVEGTVSDAYDTVSDKALGAGEAFTEAASAMSAIIPYGKNLEDSWERLNQIAQEAKQRWREAQVEGYGTIGSIRDLYASTDLRGKDAPGSALRGEKGHAALSSTKQQISSITGMPLDEINSQLKQLGEEARKTKEAMDEFIGGLNKPIDFGDLSKGVDRMLGIGAKVKSAEDSASAFMTPAYQQSQGLIDRLNEPIKVNWSQAIDQLQGVNAEAKSAEDSMSAFLQGMQGDDELAQKLREMNPELAEVSEKFQDATLAEKEYGDAAKRAAKATEESSSALSKLWKAISGSRLGKLSSQLGNIAKRMAMRAIVKELSSAFSEGVENVYRYSEAIGGTFSKDMDSAASSLLQMKNSVGAAVAPAIQMLIPLIQKVVNWFIVAINYVNQFIALLRGQSTWTKAQPVAAKAFDDQKKKAKGASDAMKDLLADWDELNIIQSQSGGGSGSGAGSVAQDYASMFTEESLFDSNVRKIVDFLKENFFKIWGIVKGIKYALKAWKLSKALTDSFPLLSKILGGAAVAATIGVTIALTDLTGKQFISSGNPGWLIADALAGAVGSKLAGSLAAKIFGGTVGTVTQGFTLILAGATNLVNAKTAFELDKQGEGWALAALGSVELGIGTALVAKGLLGAATGFSFVAGGLIAATALVLSLGVSAALAEDQIDWGTVSLTKEQVETYVQTNMFSGLDVSATVNLVNATIDKVTVTKKKLEDQIGGVIPVLTTLKLGIGEQETYEELKKQVFGDGTDNNKGLIGRVQEYADANIQELKTSIALVPVVTATGEDVSQQFLTDGITGWTEVTDYTKRLGEQLGEELSKGFTEDGLANFDEQAVKTLTDKLVRISRVITGAQIEGAAQADLSFRLSELALGDMSQETVKEVLSAFSDYRGELTREYEQIYKESANQYLILSRFYEEMANQAETAEEKEKLLDKSRKYLEDYNKFLEDMPQSVLNSVNAASAPGIEKIRDFLMDKFSEEFEGLNYSWYDADNNKTGSSSFWQTLLGPLYNFNPDQDKIEDTSKKFDTFLRDFIGGKNMFLGMLLNQMPEVNVFSLLTEEMQKDLKDVIASRYGKDFADQLFSQFVYSIPEAAEEAVQEAEEKVKPETVVPWASTAFERMKENARTAIDEVKKMLDELSSARDIELNFKSYLDGAPTTGQFFGKGNIDLNNRQILENSDGTFSTENSATIEVDGKYIVIPTVVNGQQMEIEDAVNHYNKTNQHLGMFDSLLEAEIYAQLLHERQEQLYGSRRGQTVTYPEEIGPRSDAGSSVYSGENQGGQNGSAVQIDYKEMETSVKNGATSANSDVVSELRNAVQVLQRILAKPWVVNVQPTSALGRTVGQAGAAFGRATGDNP